MDLEKYRLKDNLTGGGKSDSYRIPYKIQAGDTMPSIAQKLGRNYNQIVWPSDNWEAPLQPGQTIYASYDPSEKSSIPTNLIDTEASPETLGTPQVGSHAFDDNSTPAGRPKTQNGGAGAVATPGTASTGVITPAGSSGTGSSYSGGSVVDYLSSVGAPTDFASRAKLAASAGITNYTGTAAQNTQLLGTLRQASTASGGGQAPGGITPIPNGNPTLQAAQDGLKKLIDQAAANGQLPNGEITPDITAKFLQWAHQYVDPQTKQALQTEISDINRALTNQGAQYQANLGEIVQGFGTNLATEQNNAGATGTAFSGQRNLNEQNMANSANRSIASLLGNTNLNVGNLLSSGSSAVGSDNSSQFNIPSIAGGYVSNLGGSRGTFNPLGNEEAGNFGYSPNLYKASTIESGTTGGAGQSAVNALQANYLGQYNTLAKNNPTRSVNELFGMMSGLPSNYSTNLQ